MTLSCFKAYDIRGRTGNPDQKVFLNRRKLNIVDEVIPTRTIRKQISFFSIEPYQSEGESKK